MAKQARSKTHTRKLIDTQSAVLHFTKINFNSKVNKSEKES